MKQQLTTKSLTGINEVASKVYYNHVANKQIDNTFTEVNPERKYTKEDIETIIALYLHHARNVDIAKLFGAREAEISLICTRRTYRNLLLCFQDGKNKQMSKTVFTYNRERVISFFNNLPKEVRNLSIGILDEDKLILNTKILKSEIML